MKIKKALKSIKKHDEKAFSSERKCNLPVLSRIDRVCYSISAAIGTFIGSTGISFAAKDLLDNMKDIIVNYYDKVAGIGIGLGILLAVVAGCLMMLNPTDEGARKHRSWLVRILICICIISCLGGILAFLQNLTQGAAFDAKSFVQTIK